MDDVILRSYDADAGLRVVVAVTTGLAREGARRHGLAGLEICALGRALTASALLATLTKGGERVTVQIQGDGPIGGIVVDATDDGDARGYLLHPGAGARPCLGRGRVADILGRHGVVNVVRDLGLQDRYAAQVPLTTGEVDEDVEAYLRRSEQMPSALGCEVIVEDEAVRAAAGLLVQSLPEGDGRQVREVQHALRTGWLWERIRAGEPASLELAQEICGHALETYEERPLRFVCRCSMDRVASAMTLLSPLELDEIIASPGQAEVTCNFCGQRYVVERAQLEEIRQTTAKHPRERN